MAGTVIMDRTSLRTGDRTTVVIIITAGTATADHITRGSIMMGSSLPITATTGITARMASTLLIVAHTMDHTSLPTVVRIVAVTIIMVGTATVDHIRRGSITITTNSPTIATTGITARTANTSLTVARILATAIRSMASKRIVDRISLLTGHRPTARAMATIASLATRFTAFLLSTVRADRPPTDDRLAVMLDELPTSNGS